MIIAVFANPKFIVIDNNINKEFWQAINNEGLVLYELGQKLDAITTWEKVLIIKEDAEPMLALAAALNSIKPGNQKSIQLTQDALRKNPDYINENYRKEQLWGHKLQEATKKLLKNPKLEEAIKQAFAKSDFENEL